MRDINENEHSENFSSPDTTRNLAKCENSKGSKARKEDWTVGLWRVNAYDAKERRYRKVSTHGQKVNELHAYVSAKTRRKDTGKV